MIARAWLAFAAMLLSTLLTLSCATPLMSLPAGPGAVATDAAAALAEATGVCRRINSITAEVGVLGRVGGRRTRGRLLAGLASPAFAYLDAPAPFGASLFIFAAREDGATLLLPRDRRVLESRSPSELLEAVTGLPLDPGELRTTLTGCDASDEVAGARALGRDWRMIPGRRERYLRRGGPDDPWRLVLVVARDPGRPAWRAEYRDFSSSVPRAIRLVSAEPGAFDLQLTLSQVEINTTIDVEAFHPPVPPTFTPISIEELRDAGPMADRTSTSD